MVFSEELTAKVSHIRGKIAIADVEQTKKRKGYVDGRRLLIEWAVYGSVITNFCIYSISIVAFLTMQSSKCPPAL